MHLCGKYIGAIWSPLHDKLLFKIERKRAGKVFVVHPGLLGQIDKGVLDITGNLDADIPDRKNGPWRVL